MNVIKTEIPDVLIFEPKVFSDERGGDAANLLI